MLWIKVHLFVCLVSLVGRFCMLTTLRVILIPNFVGSSCSHGDFQVRTNLLWENSTKPSVFSGLRCFFCCPWVYHWLVPQIFRNKNDKESLKEIPNNHLELYKPWTKVMEIHYQPQLISRISAINSSEDEASFKCVFSVEMASSGYCCI